MEPEERRRRGTNVYSKEPSPIIELEERQREREPDKEIMIFLSMC